MLSTLVAAMVVSGGSDVVSELKVGERFHIRVAVLYYSDADAFLPWGADGKLLSDEAVQKLKDTLNPEDYKLSEFDDDRRRLVRMLVVVEQGDHLKEEVDVPWSMKGEGYATGMATERGTGDKDAPRKKAVLIREFRVSDPKAKLSFDVTYPTEGWKKVLSFGASEDWVEREGGLSTLARGQETAMVRITEEKREETPYCEWQLGVYGLKKEGWQYQVKTDVPEKPEDRMLLAWGRSGGFWFEQEDSEPFHMFLLKTPAGGMDKRDFLLEERKVSSARLSGIWLSPAD